MVVLGRDFSPTAGVCAAKQPAGESYSVPGPIRAPLVPSMLLISLAILLLVHERSHNCLLSLMQRINFHNLETAALKRYRRFYKLPDVGPNSSKEQLVMAVGRHFMAQVCLGGTCNRTLVQVSQGER